MSTDLSEIIKSAQNSASTLVDLLNDAKNANEHLQAQLLTYKRKYKASEAVLEAVKMERSKDRETIAKWRVQLDQAGVSPDESHEEEQGSQQTQQTQSPIKRRGPGVNHLQPLDEDVPTSSEDHVDEDKIQYQSSFGGVNKAEDTPIVLSQRVSPMSIGISDIQDSFDQNERVNIPLLSSSPPPSDQESYRKSNPQSQSQPKPKKQCISNRGDEPRVNSDNDICAARYQWLQSLVDTIWHPSDFKYEENSSQDSRPMSPDSFPFRCSHDNCNICEQSSKLLENLSLLAAQSQKGDGLEAQETPAGFWRVDCSDSSQIRTENEENAERQASEGLQRLARALWNDHYIFRDNESRYKQNLLMR